MARKGEKVKCVAMIAHTYYLHDARVRRVAECLARSGYDTHVVCARESAKPDECGEPPEKVVNGVHVYHVPLGKKRGGVFRYSFEFVIMTILGMWKLIELYLKYRFKVVHVNNMPDLLILSALPLKLAGVTLVLDVHDPMTELYHENYHLQKSSLLLKLIGLQERVCYRLADRLLTVNNSMAENVAKKAGCSKDEVYVVQNFPDSTKFPIREKMRKKWPFHGNKIRILYCGTVTEHYRLDIVIKAIAILSSTGLDVHFRILGDGNRIVQVLDLAKELGIVDRVEHVMTVKQDKVREFIDNADIGISTHRSGVFGDLYFSTKILEFMTRGLPVISSRTSVIEKLIPESAIYYFEPGNVDDLARQISFMCNNPADVIEKIKNSRKLVLKYNWEEEQLTLLSFYKDLFERN